MGPGRIEMIYPPRRGLSAGVPDSYANHRADNALITARLQSGQGLFGQRRCHPWGVNRICGA
jgi:hypothetical protein